MAGSGAGTTAGLFEWKGTRFTAVSGFEDIALDSGQALAGDGERLYVATPRGLRGISLRGNGPPAAISSKPAYSVLAAADGTVWYGCGAALCSFAGGREREWGAESGVRDGPWRAIVEDGAGRLWIRAADALLVRDAPGGSFHPAPNLPKLDSTQGSLMTSDAEGQVLIPHTGGLMVCGGAEGCRNYGAGARIAARGEVAISIEDREGSLWLGYSGQGLSRCLGKEEWQSFAEQEGLTNPGIWRIARDAAGELWVGTTRGLFHGARKAGRWRFERSGAAEELTVYGLAPDPDGSIWLGTFQPGARGLVRYDPRTRRKTVYPPAQAVERFSVNEIRRDDAGAVWVCTADGLMRLGPGARRLEAYPLPFTGSVFDVRVAGRNIFVAGKKGLYVERGAVRRVLTVADGLKDNSVQSVISAPDGRAVDHLFRSRSGSRA